MASRPFDRAELAAEARYCSLRSLRSLRKRPLFPANEACKLETDARE